MKSCSQVSSQKMAHKGGQGNETLWSKTLWLQRKRVYLDVVDKKGLCLKIKEKGSGGQGNSTVLIPATLESLVAVRDSLNEAIACVSQRMGINGGGGGGRAEGPSNGVGGGGRGGFHQQSHTGAINDRKVFVTNLAWGTDVATLEDFFSASGAVIGSTIMETRNGRKLGKGTVEFETAAGAAAAIATLDGTELDGRIIGVREDRARY